MHVTPRSASAGQVTAKWWLRSRLASAPQWSVPAAGAVTLQTYSAVAGTLPEAEEKAVGECIDADAKACPLVFNNCM